MSTFIPRDEPGELAEAGADEALHQSGADFDLGATGDAGRRLPGQGVILACVVLGAAGAIYAMRTFGMGPGRAGAEVRIDFDTQGSKALDKEEHEKLLTELGAATSLDFQVRPEEITKNPFRLAGVLRPTDVQADEIPTNTGLTPEQIAERQRQLMELRDRDVFSTLRSLEINSVIGGSRAIASINGVTYRVGDELTDGLTIHGITGRSITFRTSLGALWSLTMGEKEPVKTAPEGS